MFWKEKWMCKTLLNQILLVTWIDFVINDILLPYSFIILYGINYIIQLIITFQQIFFLTDR